MEVFYLAGTFIALFLAMLVFLKNLKNSSDYILGIWMLVISFHLASYYTYVSGVIFEIPWTMGWNIPIPFLHGPLLFLYVTALSRPEKINPKRIFIHSVLPILIIIINSPFFLLDVAEKTKVYKGNTIGYENFIFINSICLDVSAIYYVITTLILLRNHKKRILDQFSFQEKINLNWLRLLIYSMCCTWVLIIFRVEDIWIFSIATIYVVVLGFYGIRQVGIFSNQNFQVQSEIITDSGTESDSETEIDTKRKYIKSGLSNDSAALLHQKLIELMSVQALYKEPELTLAILAEKLEIHPNHLSQIINEREGCNFYDYVNNLRVAEFKKMLEKPESQKYTLIALAFECGFNSKSAFNRSFKKVTGMSPSAYHKTLLSSLKTAQKSGANL